MSWANLMQSNFCFQGKEGQLGALFLSQLNYSDARKTKIELPQKSTPAPKNAYDYRGMLTSIDSSECVYLDDGR